MFKQKLLVKIELCVVMVLLAGVNVYTPKTLAQNQSSPKQLVDEVWQILEQNYVDPSFNHQNWKAIRQQYLRRSYNSKAQAYAAIQEMVAKLGDRYTECFDPQQFQILDQDTAGNVSGVGLEVAENKTTKAVTVVAPREGTPAFKASGYPTGR
ncbi:peptidase S41, partial [Aetokthonos hydrillicola CCALA 1050]|nr:peptidase S41 [Aetokthonos hydrillicola CCALA 1050]